MCELLKRSFSLNHAVLLLATWERTEPSGEPVCIHPISQGYLSNCTEKFELA